MIELMLAMTLWGTLGAFVLWAGLSAMEIAFYRCLFGAIPMGLWMLYRKETFSLDRPTRTVSLAALFLVLNWAFLFKSFQVSSITIGNMSYYLQPIMLIIMGIFLYQEKVSLSRWGLILMALAGVLLTIDIHQLTSPHIALGVLFALLAAFLYSLFTLLMKPVQMDFFKVIFIQLAIGGGILLPFVTFHPLSTTAWACLVMMGGVHTLLAYFLYYRALQKTTFTQIAIFSYLDPIIAIGSDVLFFHRHLDSYQMGGIGLTFVALYLLVMASRQQAVPKTLAMAE